MQKPTTRFLFSLFIFLFTAGVLTASTFRFPTDSKIIYDMRFSSGGEALAIADGKTIKVYSFQSRNLLNEFSGVHDTQVMTIALSADSTLLASGDRSGLLVLWDLQTGEPLHQWQAHEDIILSADFSHDGEHLGTTGADNKVHLFDVASRENIATFTDHTEDVTVIRFQPGGTLMATGGGDSKVILYDRDQRVMVQELIRHTDWVRDLAFTSDGNILTTTGDDRLVVSWNIANLQNIRTRSAVKMLSGWNTSVDFFHDNQTLLLGSINGRIHIQTSVGKMTHKVRKPVNKALFWSNDGMTLHVVVATRGRGILVISASDMKIN
ncbi:MAG: hypothetical protein EA361_04105 [Bacteroidetes bacterium]|nr:MAG: hypothetical protein EA361_04105 [Bacteroidota bacterium]